MLAQRMPLFFSIMVAGTLLIACTSTTSVTRLPLKSSTHNLDVGETTSARIEITAPIADLNVSSVEDETRLIAAEAESVGTVTLSEQGSAAKTIRLNENTSQSYTTERTPVWNVQLTPKLPLDIVITDVSGRVKLDLEQLQLEHIVVNATSGEVHISLPEATHDYRVELVTVSSRTVIDVPDRTAVKFEVKSNISGEVSTPAFFNADGENTWMTEGFDEAESQITIQYVTVSGNVEVR